MGNDLQQAVEGLVWGILLLASAVIIAIVGIYLGRRLRYGRDRPVVAQRELIERFRQLREAGDLTADEYRQVRRSLEKRVGSGEGWSKGKER